MTQGEQSERCQNQQQGTGRFAIAIRLTTEKCRQDNRHGKYQCSRDGQQSQGQKVSRCRPHPAQPNMPGYGHETREQYRGQSKRGKQYDTQ